MGKTTLLCRVAEQVPLRLTGFTTEELRTRGARVGFRLVPFHGAGRMMAYVDLRSYARVGRYGVDIAAIDAVTGTALALDPAVDVSPVDEIGKMACLSQQFVAAVRRLLDPATWRVASIARQRTGFITEVKRRCNIELWEVTLRNRNALVAPLRQWIVGLART